MAEADSSESERAERSRLAALQQYEVLDTPNEKAFDDIATLASQICGAPIALVSLLDRERQWFKANVGLTATETPRDISFCDHAIRQDGLFEVADASLDERFAGNPLVTGPPHVRFYAGVPLATLDGHKLGTLCVLDRQPRRLEPAQQAALAALARLVMDQFELRRSLALGRLADLRYRLIVESATDYAIISMDLDGRVTSWNEGAHAILGWSANDMLGNRCDAFFTPEDREAGIPAAEMSTALARGHGNDERWHLRKDGTPFWASGEVMPLKNDRAVAVGFIKILRDRTAQQQAAQALADNEKRFRELYTAMDAGFCVIQVRPARGGEPADYRFLEANAAFEKHTGVGDPIGRWMRDIEPDLEGAWFEIFSRVAETGESVRFDQRAEALGNRWFEVYAYRVGAPEERRVAILFSEVTARREMEGSLREKEERYRALFENIDAGFCICEVAFDADGHPVDHRIVEANPAFERHTGLTDVVGRYATDVAPGLEQHWHDAYGHVARTGEQVRFEGEAKPFGRWYDAHLFPASDGRVAMLIADITERRNAETALQDLNETLEQRIDERTTALRTSEDALRQSQKMEAVGQLTGGLAHDFNNLLTGITGSLELMDIRIGQGRLADVGKYVSAAQGAAKRAAALTHRLLAFSRRQTLSPKVIDVNQLVSGMLDLIQRTVGPGIDVKSVGARDLWMTLVDPSQLENALLNLCINARDAMPRGGSITVETGNRWIDRDASLRVDLPEGQYLTLCVSDTGTGMPPETISRAFDPFFTTKPTGEGTGLGLSMVYGFAKQSGGQARIDSELGEGTRVCIYLPRHLGGVDADETLADNLRIFAAAGQTVLIVDDEPTVRMLVSDLLEDLGYAAIEASDGAGGLRVLQSSSRIDLLVTDVGLPGGMNGRQLADAARVHRPDLKVLFVTGFAENSLLSNGQLEPGMAVLTKPFAMDALAARISELLATPS